MPTPPRRRPAAGPAARRPRVAGLRKPTAHRDTDDEPLDAVEATTVEPAAAPRRPAEPEPLDGPESQDEFEPQDGSAEAPVDAFEDTAEDAADDAAEDAAKPGRASGPPPPGYRGEDGEVGGVDEAVDDGVGGVVTDGVITGAPREEGDESHENSSDEEAGAKRPSPTGKRRAGSRVAPADLRSAERSAGGRTRVKAPVEPKRRALNLAIGLAVAALLFAALGLFFKGEADRLTSGADRSNAAFTDPATTAEVKTKIISALERALSYDYRDLDKTAVAVREVLSGRAVCEYDAMFGQLKEVAPAQKLVHTTIVRELGVRSLTGDRAEALVFIDQTSTRVEKNQTTASGAQLGVTAERVDGQWKITAFDTFSQPLPNGQPLPQC